MNMWTVKQQLHRLEMSNFADPCRGTMKCLWALIALLLAQAAPAGQAGEHSSVVMTAAATKFLAGLAPEQRQQASFAFGDAERVNWHYVPRERKGLPIKVMTEPQRQLARALLKAGLSQQGYLTAAAVMDLEAILRDLEGPRSALVRDPELYFFSIFGQPSTDQTWGWRVEGHHLSLNFTLVKGRLLATAPAFYGANPAQVRQGPKKGLRVLGTEEDAGRALVQSFNPAQRERAIIQTSAPSEILTTNQLKVDPLSPAGIVAHEMTPQQRELLMKLIEVHTGRMPRDLAAERMTRLQKAGLEKIAFAWAGSVESGEKHYYRLQGPTFLVEYDNTQNDANHIHSVWRDFDGDFGRDLLHDHLENVAH